MGVTSGTARGIEVIVNVERQGSLRNARKRVNNEERPGTVRGWCQNRAGRSIPGHGWLCRPSHAESSGLRGAIMVSQRIGILAMVWAISGMLSAAEPGTGPSPVGAASDAAPPEPQGLDLALDQIPSDARALVLVERLPRHGASAPRPAAGSGFARPRRATRPTGNADRRSVPRCPVIIAPNHCFLLPPEGTCL